MSASSRAYHRFRPAYILSALAACLTITVSVPLPAQGTHLWTQSKLEEFEKGTPQGVALTSDGHLREGPGLKEVLTTPSTFVWSVAMDKNGAAYRRNRLARYGPAHRAAKSTSPLPCSNPKM